MSLIWAACLLSTVRRVEAHERTPAVLTLQEVAPGQFKLRWSPPAPTVEDLMLAFPPQCRVGEASQLPLGGFRPGTPATLVCASPGLQGSLTFSSQRSSLGRVGVAVHRLNAEPSFALASGAPPSLTLQPPGTGSALQVLRQYVELGLEHIWFGVDHLLFLLGLLLLVRGWKRLLATVTAFTVAHSLTLAAASLELVSVPSGPVEICIALSVLLLAVEATRGPSTGTRRYPWVVAFGFGLLHGLGFASALADVGLPQGAMTVSLLGFNAGVELGQITIVALAAALYRGLRHRPGVFTRLEVVTVYGLGTCSVFWLLQRVDAWLGELRLFG